MMTKSLTAGSTLMLGMALMFVVDLTTGLIFGYFKSWLDGEQTVINIIKQDYVLTRK